jgi:hypothetical protein
VCEATPARPASGAGHALYALTDFVVDNYAPIVEHFGHRLEALEREIVTDTFNREAAETLYDLKRGLPDRAQRGDGRLRVAVPAPARGGLAGPDQAAARCANIPRRASRRRKFSCAIRCA